ncbi:hypothetical protein BDF20DRAFT_842384 [Mycotypha africana]|uniref:uncharacterized protein n=1 Tax=Mycotypha africana TaxID=64632 RepID=UPI00230014B6|nr:uncharacterized protein BDF20DRAFT_842384 [Mycotypha africana]KAI8991051.1 hypothetical protein BDF20DRAFT_842384 [Mycotypha africana]
MSNKDDNKDDQQDAKFEFNKHSNTSKRKPQQHRCNGHLEDVLEGLTQWPLDVAKPFGLFLTCLRSQPGQEPPRYKHHEK